MKIAIVGAACRYPGANSPKELFENIIAGRRYFREMPKQRWSVDDYFNDDPKKPDATYCKFAALLEDFEFNPAEFKIPHSTYLATDQAQWLALATAREALDDADQKRIDPIRTAVVLGNSLAGETSRAQILRYRWPYTARVFNELFDELKISGAAREKLMERIEKRYKEPFAPIDEDSLAGALSNTIPGRICNYFDFKGGGYTVDGACSSSLLAVIQACVGLENGDFDFALAGGVDISLDPFELLGFAKVGALSATDIKVYDQRSNGFLPGEGCGVIALKRLDQALADGDRVYAAITGWGYSSDGKGGLTAPSVNGQGLAIERAYNKAGYGLGEVELLEGHGTGTPLGDRVELSGIVQGLQRSETSAEHRCGIGSIKSNIGHTKAAAGIAGLLKATLSVYYGILPPTQSVQVPNEVFAKSDHLYPLIHGEKWANGKRRRAGVSSAGFGGINTHVTLEEITENAHSVRAETLLPLLHSAQDSEVFFIGADDISSLLNTVRMLKDAAGRAAHAQLLDLAAYCAKLPSRKSVRLSVVADSPQTLVARLSLVESLLQGNREVPHYFSTRDGIYLGRTTPPPRIAFLFPGQGSQRLNAGRLWKSRFGFIDKFWGECDATLSDLLPRNLSSYVFRDAHKENLETRRMLARELEDTTVAQPAIVAGSMAFSELLRYFGIEPEISLGHSLGEYTALWSAGALTSKDALRLVARRGQAMAQSAPVPGAMLSISCAPERAAQLLKRSSGYVTISNYNAPQQTVVSGDKNAIEELREICRQQSIEAVLLPVSNAFHSKLMDSARQRMRKHFSQAEIGELKRLFVSTTTGNFIPAGTKLDDVLSDQMTSPVRFVEAVEAVLAEDCRLLVEVGPGGVLGKLARKIIGDRQAWVFSTDSSNAETMTQELNNLLAFAFASGLPVRTHRVFENRFTRSIQLPYTPKFIESPCEKPVSRLSLPRGVSAVLGEGQAYEEVSEEITAPVEVHEDATTVTRESILRMMQVYISQQFGYPLEMVHAKARFQDDLNLDSIKSVEVVAEAMGRLAISADPTTLVTAPLEEIAQKLLDMKQTPAAEASSQNPLRDLPVWVRAFATELESQPLDRGASLTPRRFAIMGNDNDKELTEILCRRLQTAGHAAAVAANNTDLASANACVIVLPRASDTSHKSENAIFSDTDLYALPLFLLQSVKSFLHAIKASGEPEPMLAVIARAGGNLGRAFGAETDDEQLAASGFVKTLSLEHPEMKLRFLDVGHDVDANAITEIILQEMGAPDKFSEAGYPTPQQRLIPKLRLSPLATLEPAEAALGARDVLLISGGARGITAECALEVAKKYRSRLALLGSTPLNGDAARDAEVARNLQRFKDAGVEAAYYQCDLTDARKVTEVIAKITHDMGPVTAVWHAAGLNRPHRIESVSEAELVNILKPKMLGLYNLLTSVDLSKLKLLVSFSSIIAKSGMAGNADYAYANEWLNLVLTRVNAVYPHIRSLSYNFSVWADVGMGVDSVERLQRLGIDAIPLAQGVECMTALLERRWPVPDLVVASRLGGLPTIRFASSPFPRARFLEKIISYQPGVELVTETDLCSDIDRYLLDHDYHGSLLFPAVMGMEAMAQTAYACLGESPSSMTLALENMQFDKPVVVPEEGRAIRIYAQVIDETHDVKRLRVSVRSSVTNYELDHFSADSVFTRQPRPERFVEQRWEQPLAVDPHQFMYGSIFFQGPMFQNIISYHDLSSQYCVAKIKNVDKVMVFSDSSGFKTMFGSPERRDAFLHAVQACVPEYRILPVAIERIDRHAVSVGDVYLIAKERFRSEQEFCYDLEVCDQDGLIVEELRGFRCRIMEPYRDEATLGKILHIHREASNRHHAVKAQKNLTLQVSEE